MEITRSTFTNLCVASAFNFWLIVVHVTTYIYNSSLANDACKTGLPALVCSHLQSWLGQMLPWFGAPPVNNTLFTSYTVMAIN